MSPSRSQSITRTIAWNPNKYIVNLLKLRAKMQTSPLPSQSQYMSGFIALNFSSVSTI
tara:strand:+ start:89492 stop:89665 length:174 start_codon:yes stop_codon:yes gene_type:complete